ncbi:hypothetical protein N431DRAFT_479736 [Stipitochalara longipes BDJ]|nr:hypothetical protein N431DRAFT_479736 [Stipitochalara longipes BDJ]
MEIILPHPFEAFIIANIQPLILPTTLENHAAVPLPRVVNYQGFQEKTSCCSSSLSVIARSGDLTDSDLEYFETDAEQGFGFNCPNSCCDLLSNTTLDLLDLCNQAPHQAFGQGPDGLDSVSLLESTSTSQQASFFEEVTFWAGEFPAVVPGNNYRDFISPDLSLDPLVNDTYSLLLNPPDNQAILEEELQLAEAVGNFSASAASNLDFVSGVPEDLNRATIAPLPTRAHTTAISTAGDSLFASPPGTISEIQGTSPTGTSSSFPLPRSTLSDSVQSSNSPHETIETGITCAWHGCQKVFSTVSDYNHHCKSHTRPHQCSMCRARFANKGHLARHVNECHTHAEKYYCPIATCKRSQSSGRMLPFLREDNCQKHIKKHRLRGLQAKECDMDNVTKDLRKGRKARR